MQRHLYGVELNVYARKVMYLAILPFIYSVVSIRDIELVLRGVALRVD